MSDTNLYALLGLNYGVGDRQIREAYRRLAKKYHPDLNPANPRAGEQFKEIAHAYWILSDSLRRKAYLDANPHLRKDPVTRHRQKTAPTGEPPKKQSQEGKNIIVKLYLTLEELAEGVMKKVKIHRRQSCKVCEGTGIAGGAKSGFCSVCHGSGEVPDFLNKGSKGSRTIPCRKCGGTGINSLKACSHCGGLGQDLRDVYITVGVPPGTADKEKIVVISQGHEGFLGGKPGDLKVTIYQKPHPYLQRRGDDLEYRCSITLSQWLDGGELRVPSLQGSIALKIKSRELPDRVLKVRGRGMPKKGGGHGDLIVKYSLCIPEKLNNKQLSLLKRLEVTKGFTPEIDEKGFCRRK